MSNEMFHINVYNLLRIKSIITLKYNVLQQIFNIESANSFLSIDPILKYTDLMGKRGV